MESISFEHSNSVIDTMRELNNINPNEFSGEASSYHQILIKAAKKRGLKIERDSNKNRTKLYHNYNFIGEMIKLKPSTTDTVAFSICKDKLKTEELLVNQNINMPSSKLFMQDEKDKAFEYVRHNSPIEFVIKPLSMSSAEGISLNVTEENFESAWKLCFASQKKTAKKKCLIQNMIKGYDIRVVIIEGLYSAATIRLPAHIVGDGFKSIEQLIDEKNDIRIKNPYLKNKLIRKDDILSKKLYEEDLDINSILDRGAVYVLDPIANLVFGGESIDITNIISTEIVNLAEKAVASIPGLYSAGVDIITEDFLKGPGFVIEVNTNANHTLNSLPHKGSVPHPIELWVDSMIVKYKLKEKIALNDNELSIASDMQKFIDYKQVAFSSYYKNSLVISEKTKRNPL